MSGYWKNSSNWKPSADGDNDDKDNKVTWGKPPHFSFPMHKGYLTFLG